MGITGLLPFVKAASTNTHLSNFRGQTAAIDSYCWLHKGAFGCAEKLAKGESTDMYVTYCFKYIDMLQSFRIKPIMVFDGQHLPAKLLTEKKRRESRNLARKQAKECLRLGKLEEARSNFRRCVDITPEMALTLIKECRKRNIDCIVAPYEADAQLAYLNRNKIVNFIISEDSDLLVFGCSKVVFKLDLNGTGTLVEADKLYLSTQERPDEFSFDRFRQMCILSGCDYIDSLPGIGLKKALKFLKRISNTNIYDNIGKLPSILNMKQLTITKEYREEFMIAEATFKHQLVFDIFERKLIPMIDLEKSGTDEKYLVNSGKMLENMVAFQLAIGNLNPLTLEVMDNWDPEKALKARASPSSSIWSKSYKVFTSEKVKKKQTSPVKSVNTIKEEIIDDTLEENIYKIYSIHGENTPKRNRENDETSLEEPESKMKCVSSDLDEINCNDLKISPVLSNRCLKINPFIKKPRRFLAQKLITVVDERNVVVSKYFSNQTNSQTDETKEITNLISETTISENSDSTTLENSESIISENSETTISENSETTISKSSEATISENGCKNKNINDDELLISSSQESTASNEENDTNISNLDIPIVTKKITNSTATTIKKTQMTICRRVGLSKNSNKKNNKSNKQQTVLSMFGFTKK